MLHRVYVIRIWHVDGPMEYEFDTIDEVISRFWYSAPSEKVETWAEDITFDPFDVSGAVRNFWF